VGPRRTRRTKSRRLRPTIQFLANHGYAVLAVNNRGSSGYGKTFFHMDDKKHGEVDLKDVVHGRRYLEGLDWVDGKRVGNHRRQLRRLHGLCRTGIRARRLRLRHRHLRRHQLGPHAGEHPALVGQLPRVLYAELGDPKTDGERLRRISPLFHAKNIKKPLLVIQGANDPRVLVGEDDVLDRHAWSLTALTISSLST